jgi:hypothetical protein
MNDEQYRLEMEEYYRQKYRDSIAIDPKEQEYKSELKTAQGEYDKLLGKNRKKERNEYNKLEEQIRKEDALKQVEADNLFDKYTTEDNAQKANQKANIQATTTHNEEMIRREQQAREIMEAEKTRHIEEGNKVREEVAASKYNAIWDKQDAIDNHEKLKRGDTTMLDPDGNLSKKEIRQQYEQALEANKHNVLQSRDEVMKTHDPNRYMLEQDDIYARQQFAERNAAREVRNPKTKTSNPTIKATAKTTQETAEEVAKTLDDVNDKAKFTKALKKYGSIPSLINIGATVAEFKEARKEGHGVVKSATKAGLNFAVGEALGPSAILFYGLKSAPQLAVSGVEGISKMNRDMNSMKRFETFGSVSFQDTQQLSTMRQSGMELAKMSQYNLQQTLMGTEAQHLHR